MIELYLSDQGQRIELSIMLVGSVVLQTLLVVFNVNRFKISWLGKVETIFEIFILWHLVILTNLVARIQFNALEGYYFLFEYTIIRYINFIGVIFMGIWLLKLGGRVGKVCSGIGVILTLPCMEKIAGERFVMVFYISVLFWIARGLIEGNTILKQLYEQASRNSVKRAIDTLPTGILFCQPSGEIVLINEKMLELMRKLTGITHRNGQKFFEQLEQGECKEFCKQSRLDENLVYELPDQTFWMFIKSEIQIKKKIYIQLAALDVSERWQVSNELAKKQESIKQRADELIVMIQNMKKIQQEKQWIQAKTRIHDILGHRISVLLRSVQDGSKFDEEIVKMLKEGIPIDDNPIAMSNQLQQIIDMMQKIGVTVHLIETMPREKKRNRVLCEIITEAITNAVRHGFATEITIQLKDTSKGKEIEIWDNGIGKNNSIMEHGGLQGMRQKLKEIGGTLQLNLEHSFRLIIQIPGGEQDD